MVSIQQWFSRNAKLPVLITLIFVVFIQVVFLGLLAYNDYIRQVEAIKRIVDISSLGLLQNNRTLIESTFSTAIYELGAKKVSLCKNGEAIISHPIQDNLCSKFERSFTYRVISIAATGMPEYLFYFQLPVFGHTKVALLMLLLSLIFASGATMTLVQMQKRIKKDILNPLKIVVKSDFETQPHIIISEISNLLQQLKFLKSKVAMNAHLATLGMTASYVAHDMRSPLQVIKGYIDDAEYSVEARDSALNSVAKLNKMADELLDYAKATNLQKITIPARMILDKNVRGEIDKALTGTKTRVEFNSMNSNDVHIDLGKLKRVVINLVTNAIHAIEHDSGFIKIDLKTDENSLSIKVTDNGKGIEDVDQEKIFDCFFTKGKKKGSGLGLAYCKNVVEAHGGTITVQSELGKGSVFTVEIPGSRTLHGCVIPVKDAGIQPKADPPMAEKPAATNSKSNLEIDVMEDILVVDDDLGMRLQWKDRVVKRFERQAITAESYEELIKMPMEYEKIRLAIVDYQFDNSEYNGLDVVKFLKEKGVKLVCMCTGMYHDDDLVREAKTLGVHKVIPKPIPNDVFEMIGIG